MNTIFEYIIGSNQNGGYIKKKKKLTKLEKEKKSCGLWKDLRQSMKVGDFVRIPEAHCNALIIDIDDSHRQKAVTVMTEHGYILERIWIARIEVIDEDR